MLAAKLMFGVTTNYPKRIEKHMRQAFKEDSGNRIHRAMRESLVGFSAGILFHDSEDECYKIEKKMRAESDMGLNTVKGGRAISVYPEVPKAYI